MELCKEPDMDGIRRAIFSIDPNSALGPDGFCSRFYLFSLLDSIPISNK